VAQASGCVEIYFVIPNEVRNLSLIEMQERRDSSARGAPRNDKYLSFWKTIQLAGLSSCTGQIHTLKSLYYFKSLQKHREFLGGLLQVRDEFRHQSLR
jgi:hypothetical protein